MSSTGYDEAYAARQLSRSRSPLRRLIKGFYLRDVLSDIHGPTIDFGCGAGQLLNRLPAGSLGLEVNPSLVAQLKLQGLNVQRYDPGQDLLCFTELASDQYQTFVMSHVLEHFDDAAGGLRKILSACRRLHITRVVIVVPGEKGYAFDDTHRSFVNRDYLKHHNLLNCEGYSVTKMRYFPINLKVIGKFFTFHELKLIYDKL